jgi:hypothetical protein
VEETVQTVVDLHEAKMEEELAFLDSASSA